MFTSYAFIGWHTFGGFTGRHKDSKNLMTIFISVGDDVHSGGTTLFYLKRENGDLDLVLAISHSVRNFSLNWTIVFLLLTDL
jgi:hypothetical protein